MRLTVDQVSSDIGGSNPSRPTTFQFMNDNEKALLAAYPDEYYCVNNYGYGDGGYYGPYDALTALKEYYFHCSRWNEPLEDKDLVKAFSSQLDNSSSTHYITDHNYLSVGYCGSQTFSKP
jgi:hypothetical protein